ncbi:MAG TPA: nuclear transport factor 2 family protein [Cyclobacteriaceae bacterium]|nr:nuclear transport factor 2 family protein [Cyclobacteriaceae bacterium]
MKKLLFLIWLIAVLGSCTTQDPAAANRAIANRMFDAFNKHDWEGMASCYSETASFLDPSFGTEYVPKTRKETVAKYNEMTKLFPDLHDEVTGMYTSGDKVIAEFIATGSMSDSVKFRIPIAIVLTMKDGLIVKDATYYDPPDQEN